MLHILWLLHAMSARDNIGLHIAGHAAYKAVTLMAAACWRLVASGWGSQEPALETQHLMPHAAALVRPPGEPIAWMTCHASVRQYLKA